MAEKSLGSKRGQYSDLEATAGKEKGVWEVRNIPKPKRLSGIDKKRNALNKQINGIRQILISSDERRNVKQQKDYEDNVERWINRNIYGTKPKGKSEPIKEIRDKNVNVNDLSDTIKYRKSVLEGQITREKKETDKEKKQRIRESIKTIKEGIERQELRLDRVLTKEEKISKPKRYSNPDRIIRISDLLKEGRAIYTERKPLDKESKDIRANYNRSYKSIYDVKRYAGKKKNARVWINGKPFLASQVTLVSDEQGKRYILPKGAISNWKLGSKAKFSVSSNPTKIEVVSKTKVVKPAQDKIVFEQDSSGRLFTKTNIKRLFDKAEKEHGQRIIFINNQAIMEDEFFQENGFWYLGSYATAEFQAGTQEVSLVYNPSYIVKTNELIKKRVEIAQKPILKELTSTVMIGGKNQKVHIIIYTKEALLALKEARTLRKGGAPVSWLATQYTITENMNKKERARLNELNARLEVSLNEKEKEELAHLKEQDKINIVVEVQNAKTMNVGELKMYQDTHTEWVALSWLMDKTPSNWIFAVAIKMNTEESIAGAVEYVGAGG